MKAQQWPLARADQQPAVLDAGERYPVQLRPNTSDPPTSESTEGVGVQAKRDNIYPGSLSTAMSWTWCAEQGRAVVLWIDEGMMSATLVPGLSVATMTVE